MRQKTAASYTAVFFVPGIFTTGEKPPARQMTAVFLLIRNSRWGSSAAKGHFSEI